jgi:hypothetical protein
MKNALALLTLFIYAFGNSQSLPDAFYISQDNHLHRGGFASEGFYDESTIDTIYLYFEQADYWTQMQDNYCDKINVLASLVYQGETFDSVGVRFKGQTSYANTNGTGGGPGGGGVLTDKKSFNIELDWIKNHDINGYETLNLNNCYQDPSFLKEILFENIARDYIPAAKVNFVELFINDESWGLYPSVQQLDKKHAGEWFLDDECSRWRAEDPETTSAGCGGSGGGPGGGGPGSGPDFGAGSSSLNYLGDAVEDYTSHYTLKKSYVDNSWEALIEACLAVDNAANFEDVYTELNQALDVDATLWHLATEIIFSDDDSYIHKGGMDYYVYYDKATERILPMEYDGNSVMSNSNDSWSPFYNQNDEEFALLNKLLAIPELRQRYIAHFRTILEEKFPADYINEKIDDYADFIDLHVSNDPQKIYSYNEFIAGVEDLKGYFSSRKTYLESNAELMEESLEILSLSYSVNGVEEAQPTDGDKVIVQVEIEESSAAMVSQLVLYYATGIMGVFEKIAMTDLDGDLVFEVEIPEFPSNTYVRFYVEAISEQGVRTYEPVGAEHDVYVYKVASSGITTDGVVINEVMASNSSVVADEFGEYDDWIELYNNSSEAIDLSNYYLSDRYDSLYKWTFPVGTIIEGNSYLIVWADKDEDQGGLHANFKLSGSGEGVYLSDVNQELVDELLFFTQQTDVSYGRYPNGTGDFEFLSPSFNASNTLLSLVDEVVTIFDIYPNPATSRLNIVLDEKQVISIYSLRGELVCQKELRGEQTIDISELVAGVYFVADEKGRVRKLIVSDL